MTIQSTSESARRFLFDHHHASLGTVMHEGGGAHVERSGIPQPYVSAVNMLASHEGCLLLQVSRLAQHSRNLLANSACSLLLMSPDREDFQQSPRLSVQGVAGEVPSSLGSRYLRLFPHSRAYLDLDFYFLSVEVKEARWIEGFARAHWLDGSALRPADDLSGWNDQVELELIDQLTAEFSPTLQGVGLGEAVFAAIDPWGLWLLREGQPRRLHFDLPAKHPSEVRATVAQMFAGT